MKKQQISILMAVVLCFLLTGCGTKQEQSETQEFYAMDTSMRITAYGDNARNAVTECVSYINMLEADLSRTRESSNIFKLNHAEGAPTELSQQTVDVLQKALDLAEKTDGYFDPTIAPLSDLWGIGTEEAAVPSQEEIDRVLPLIDYTKISLQGTTASLPAEVEIDLGGIGKGYAADQVIKILKKNGIEQAIVALGGNVYVLGKKDANTPWKVGVTDPDHPGDAFATLSVSDTAVVTSGDYERYLEVDGKRYCHIFDPETGYSADTDLRSVTVVSTDSTSADAYTTALFVMGLQNAMAFCKQHGIEAVFVCNDHTVYVTDGLKSSFELQNTEYTYVE